MTQKEKAIELVNDFILTSEGIEDAKQAAIRCVLEILQVINHTTERIDLLAYWAEVLKEIEIYDTKRIL